MLSCTNAIAEMIACNNLTFSFVEDEEVVNLIEKAHPQHKVHNKEYIKANVIPSLNENCCGELPLYYWMQNLLC